HAEVAVEGGALLHDDRHGGEREHVVDYGRLAEQTLVRGQRRLRADFTAFAFEAVEQRGFLAADVSPRPRADFHVKGEVRARHVRTEKAAAPRRLDRIVHDGDRVRIFRADVDVALGRADGDAGDGHALDEHEGIALHDHAVGEGAAVAL